MTATVMVKQRKIIKYIRYWDGTWRQEQEFIFSIRAGIQHEQQTVLFKRSYSEPSSPYLAG